MYCLGLLQDKQQRIVALESEVVASTTEMTAATHQLNAREPQLSNLQGVISDKDILIGFLEGREADLDTELTFVTHRLKLQLLHACEHERSAKASSQSLRERSLVSQTRPIESDLTV